MNLPKALAYTLMTVLAPGLSSCSSPKLKAPAASLSPFLSSSPPLAPDRKLSPFALSGGTPLAPERGIYIAPVSITHLRGASKSLAKGGGDDADRQRAAVELAEYARQQFIAAFEKSPKARYVVRKSPDPDCITLELALTELNRNTIAGSVARYGLNTVALPGTDAVLARTTRGLKGNIAIEGKLKSSGKGKVVYQFADNEESKSAFLLPITDFAAYGQAREAIRDWAKQFEEVTRTPSGQRVKDSSVMSLF